jgi:hypothetical protein
MAGTEIGPGALRVHCAGRDYAFGAGQSFTIGREADCEVRTENPLVSRHHVRVVHGVDGWTLEDAGSSRGTHVDGRRIERQAIDGTVAVWLGPESSGERVVFSIVDPASNSPALRSPADVATVGAGAVATRGGGVGSGSPNANRTPLFIGVAIVLVLMLGIGVVIASSGDDDKPSDPTGNTGVTVPLGDREVEALGLAVRGDGESSEGLTIPLTVRVRPTPGEPIGVSAINTEAGATGDQWAAASWNAAMVATLITGGEADGFEFSYRTDGPIDGPSAGGLMTVATIAAIRGDTLDETMTMTGAINPDGTIGPVGGIPFKLEGAADAGRTTMLIPEGENKIEGVDVIDKGRSLDPKVDVIEVGDIFEAYEQFTGVELPRLTPADEPSLSEVAKERFEAKVGGALADFDGAIGEFQSLDATIQDALLESMQQAAAFADEANALEAQDLEAGALDRASSAAAFGEAVVEAGRLVEIYANEGIDPFYARLEGIATQNERSVEALFQTIKSDQPQTIADADILMQTSGIASTALALNGASTVFIDQLNQATTEEELFSAASSLAFFRVLEGKLVEHGENLFELGRVANSPALPDAVNIDGVERFFSQAAIANLVAFESLKPGDGSADGDLDYVVAAQQRASLDDVLEKYFGDAVSEESATYYKLGTALSLYSRSAGLNARYYSLNIQGVVAPLDNAIDLGRILAESSIGLLTDEGIEVPLVISQYEVAGVSQGSDPGSALESLWSAYIESRALAYLMGIQAKGFE